MVLARLLSPQLKAVMTLQKTLLYAAVGHVLVDEELMLVAGVCKHEIFSGKSYLLAGLPCPRPAQ
jgi:hypothetical protein